MMGNYKFRLSDMMPNAWFYKLKDMSTTSNPSMKMAKKKKKKKKKNKKYQNQNHGSPSVSVSASASASASVLPSRTSIDSFLPIAHSCSYSHSFNGHLPRTAFELHSSPVNSPDFPRKSSRIKSKRKTVYRPSPYLLRQKLFSAHWKQSLWTNEDLNSSPPGHYFASPAPPTDGDGYDSSSPDPKEPYSSSDEVAASPPACSNYNRKTIGSSTATTTTDIIIDMNHENSTTPKMKNLKDRGRIKSALEPKLPPLSTRRATSNVNSSADHAALRRASFKLDSFRQHDHPTLHIQVDDGESFQPQNDQKASRHTAQKSPSVTSTGMRLRTNASRVASRKMRAARARKSLSSSIAACVNFTNKNLASSLVITKLSVDPQSDFRDSMEEMIIGHNIRASTDLEDLLTCYLSLNSREYHDHIVRAFEDIWFDVL